MTGRTHKRLFAIGITIALLAATAWGEERTWTDDSDAFTLVAELVEVRGDEVVLRRQDGKQITVPLARLSKKDLLFLVQRLVPQNRLPNPLLAVAPFDGRQAKAHQKAWADHLGTPVQITNSLGMILRLIPPGEFTMGSPASEKDRRTDEVQYRVRITKPFYLSSHEVTQAQYEQVTDKNPSYYTALGNGKDRVSGIDTSQFPVEQVTWGDAVAFCRKLSNQEGGQYRLPTEAEWEYACRAGTTTAYGSGSGLLQLGTTGWFGDNSGKNFIDSARIWETDEASLEKRLIDNGCRPHVVGRKAPNAWSLYDMHGNVSEWCQDWYGPYESFRVVSDPTGPASGSVRVLRGGAFFNQPKYVRAAVRNLYRPVYLGHAIGFRLARTIPLSP